MFIYKNVDYYIHKFCKNIYHNLSLFSLEYPKILAKCHSKGFTLVKGVINPQTY
nr:MAG TPA: hypothetical protein [Caudoviricetes sp.]